MLSRILNKFSDIEILGLGLLLDFVTKLVKLIKNFTNTLDRKTLMALLINVV